VTRSVARAQPIYAVFAAEFPTQSQANKGVALAESGDRPNGLRYVGLYDVSRACVVNILLTYDMQLYSYKPRL
jgi:hypothetical protein